MTITENVTVTLNEEELNELIKDKLKREGFEIVGKIKVNVGTVSRGYGQMEHDVTEFQNITATAKRFVENPGRD